MWSTQINSNEGESTDSFRILCQNLNEFLQPWIKFFPWITFTVSWARTLKSYSLIHGLTSFYDMNQVNFYQAPLMITIYIAVFQDITMVPHVKSFLHQNLQAICRPLPICQRIALPGEILLYQLIKDQGRLLLIYPKVSAFFTWAGSCGIKKKTSPNFQIKGHPVHGCLSPYNSTHY